MFGDEYKQENITAGGDVAGRDINNYYKTPVTWYQKRFEALIEEVKNDQRYEQTIEDLEFYNTILPGTKDLESKLKDGGFTCADINSARLRKMKFAKKMEKYKYYYSAQIINSHLFADVLLKFEDYVKPLINKDASKDDINLAVSQKVIDPIMEKLEVEGADDTILCYDRQDILGIVYYLTGICHINWTNYDNVQSSL